jgi:hypothetical protein
MNEYVNKNYYNVSVFIKTLTAKDNTRVYNGKSTDTVKDIKRFIRTILGLPRYECSLFYHTYVQDTELIAKYDQCTVHLLLSLTGGPVQLLPDIFDILSVNVVLPNCIRNIKLNVKPYWYINGRNGVISRILEELDINGYQNNLQETDVQLIYNGSPMNPNLQLAKYDGLTRKYIQFTQISGIVKYFYNHVSLDYPPSEFTLENDGFVDNVSNNPYGYISPIVSVDDLFRTKQGKMLILELKDKSLEHTKHIEYTEFDVRCVRCVNTKHPMSKNIGIISKCGHTLCMDCVQNWTNTWCPKCNKNIM